MYGILVIKETAVPKRCYRSEVAIDRRVIGARYMTNREMEALFWNKEVKIERSIGASNCGVF